MSRKHLSGLDGLRGIAILSVLLFHCRAFLGGPFFLDGIVARFARSGWAGVDLFFVLSGFLITGILLDTSESPNYFSSFYARRMLRVFPIYFAALLFLFAVCFNVPALRFLAPNSGAVWYFTYLNNWPVSLDAASSPSVSHFWSLAIEEQFYLLWPFLVWKIAPGRLMAVCTAVAITSPVLRWALLHYGVDPEWQYRNTLTRADALAIGAAGAVLLRLPPAALWLRRHRIGVLAMAMGALGCFFAAGSLGGSFDHAAPWMEKAGFSLCAVTALLFVLLAATGGTTVFLDNRLLRSFGRYSYGIYVFHVPLLLAMKHYQGDALNEFVSRFSGIPVALSLIVICFACGALSFEFFERPILRLKKYFEPNQRALHLEGRRALTKSAA